MPDTQLSVEIDGSPLGDDEISSLVEVIAEETLDAGDALALVASLAPTASGEWTSLLDDLTAPRTPVTIEIARGDVSYRFDGTSAEVDWQLDAAGVSHVSVRAIDATFDMDSEEKARSWPGTSDSGIATAIFGEHGLGTQVDDTPDGPDPDVHVVMQRATDWAFVRSLARKWGFSTFIEARDGLPVGHFRVVDPLADPQAVLALGFGSDATRATASVRFGDGQRIVASRLRALSDATDSADASGDDQVQGSRSLGALTTTLLSPSDVDGEIDATAAATGRARETAFAASLELDLDVELTGTMLRARRTVLIRGLGSQLSGLYLVHRVRNRVTPDGHHQSATLRRNALGLSGTEDFAGAGSQGALGGVL